MRDAFGGGTHSPGRLRSTGQFGHRLVTCSRRGFAATPSGAMRPRWQARERQSTRSRERDRLWLYFPRDAGGATRWPRSTAIHRPLRIDEHAGRAATRGAGFDILPVLVAFDDLTPQPSKIQDITELNCSVRLSRFSPLRQARQRSALPAEAPARRAGCDPPPIRRPPAPPAPPRTRSTLRPTTGRSPAAAPLTRGRESAQ
jgi:hypothetical protein